MNVESFKLALNNLEPSDWNQFEILSSAFLSTDLPGLRTMAAPSGDGGRDSEIFTSDNKPHISAQYSVTKKWKPKVHDTITKLIANFPSVRVLIYTSPWQIGADADELRSQIQDNHGIALDIRDQSWFCERMHSNPSRSHAAEDLIQKKVIPLLKNVSISDNNKKLTTTEAKSALVYLGLQLEDDSSDKGLSRLSFDGIVRSILRNTNSNERLTRSQIHEKAALALPSLLQEDLIAAVNSSLARQGKNIIKHWEKTDEYCLSHEEHQRIQNRLVIVESEKRQYFDEIESISKRYISIKPDGQEDELLHQAKARIPRIIENLLFSQGELFVSSVAKKAPDYLNRSSVIDAVYSDIAANPFPRMPAHFSEICAASIRDIIGTENEYIHRYLLRLTNAYTIYSFLRETPDINSLAAKLFSFGEIWLDTSIVLPALLGTIDDPYGKQLSNMLTACQDAGMKFYVTHGIINEINSHMHNCVQCSINQYWNGKTPFLLRKFLESGRSINEFQTWISQFRGKIEPENDIELYLKEERRISVYNLDEIARSSQSELRESLDRVWTNIHEARRGNGNSQLDEMSLHLLIQHDIETYLGVVQLRSKEPANELGFKHWLLTLDSTSWKIRDQLQSDFGAKAPRSPLLALSFLLNVLTFGSIRNRVKNEERIHMPLIFDPDIEEFAPTEILSIATSVRKKNEGSSEGVIRREVKDGLNMLRFAKANTPAQRHY